MPYSYRSRRLNDKKYHKTKKKFYTYFFLVILILYLTFAWILPLFVNGLGFIRNSVTPDKSPLPNPITDNETLAPPVIGIPFEATNTAQIIVEGYANSHEIIELYVDDVLKKEVSVENDGKFRIDNLQLSIGNNTIYAKSKKGTFTSLPSKSYTVIYDIDKPILKLHEPEDNKQVVSDRTLKISGKTDSNTKIFVNDNQVAVDGNGNFTTTKQLVDGNNNFEIKGVDTAQNTTTITRTVHFTP